NDVVIPVNPEPAGNKPLSFFTRMSPGFFDVMAIPLLAGRDVTDSDTANSPPVAIVNLPFARNVFGTEKARGPRVTTDDGGRRLAKTFEVIGIAGDTKIESLREEYRPMVYIPDTQIFGPGVAATFVVQTNMPMRDAMSAVLKSVAELNPAISVGLHVFKT